MKLFKGIFIFTLSAAVAVASLGALTRLVQPKYDGSEFPVEGSFTAEYYDETSEHDVLMLGDDEVYENFDPICLWKEYGITSYIRGNASQLAWQSYYMLEDALKNETPKVVIYGVRALAYDKPVREEYNRMVLDGMKWSKTKWDAINASMCKGEKMIDYIFPLLRYHSRITELKEEDITYYTAPRKVTCNGYYMRIDTLPASKGADKRSVKKVDNEVKFADRPMKYLEMMRTLCESKGIKLILVKSPSLEPGWSDDMEQQIVSYATEHGLAYINFNNLKKETEIDYETDTYDGGLHMNYNGAYKLSTWLGKELKEKYGINDHRADKKLAGVYREKVEWQQKIVDAQKAELDLYGEIRNY